MRDLVSKWLNSLNWRRALAQILVLSGYSLWACMKAHSLGYHLFVVDLLFCLHTSTIIIFIGLGGVFSGKIGTSLWQLSLVITSLCGTWMVASVELFIAQGRLLLWPEIIYRFTDPTSRAFAFSVLGDMRLWSAIAGGIGGGNLLSWGLAQISVRWTGMLWLGLIFTVKIGATWWVLQHSHDLADGYHGMRTVYAPWHSVNDELAEFGLREANPEVARSIRGNSSSPLFAPGGDMLWSRLKNTYPGRSLVVISMESHRLSNTAPLGEGAVGFQNASPRLQEWGKRGITFSHVIQVGQHTNSMAWSMVTGLPNQPDFEASILTPQLAVFGPAKSFVDAGYEVSWLQATNTNFASLDHVLMHAGAAYIAETKDVISASEKTTAWGMADQDLLRVASRRIDHWRGQGKPYLMMVATVSNHQPFVLPGRLGGVALTQDYFGGMRYADDALDQFLQRCWDLPVVDRPLIYVTADHTFRDYLSDAKPAGLNGPEGFRLPGLLLLPDEAEAGVRFDGMMCHQDVLDLLAYLTSNKSGTGDWKFSTHHRVAVGMIRGSACNVITDDGFFDAESNQAWHMSGLWHMQPAEPAQEANLRALSVAVHDEVERIWPPAIR